MTPEQLLNKIEGTINDVADGAQTKEEALSNLVTLFLTELDPFVQSRKHLQLFIYRVWKMRSLQQEFFKGNRKVQGEAMKHEKTVDDAVKKLTTELGYDIEKLKQQYEPQKMF